MNSTKPWVADLNITEEEFAQWLEQKEPNESVTNWALRTDKIPTDTYLEWARNYYGLPSLRSDFLDEPSPAEFWREIAPVCEWPQSLIPLTMWDGTIFIACIEPPENQNWSFDVQYILISHRDLEQLGKSFYMITEEPTDLSQLPPVPSDSVATPIETNLDNEVHQLVPKGDIHQELEQVPQVIAIEQSPTPISSDSDIVVIESPGQENLPPQEKPQENNFSNKMPNAPASPEPLPELGTPPVIEELPPTDMSPLSHIEEEQGENPLASEQPTMLNVDLLSTTDLSTEAVSELPDGFNFDKEESIAQSEEVTNLNQTDTLDFPGNLNSPSIAADMTSDLQQAAHSVDSDQPFESQQLTSSEAINDPTPEIPVEALTSIPKKSNQESIPSDHNVFEQSEDQTAQLPATDEPFEEESENIIDFSELTAVGLGGTQDLAPDSYQDAKSQGQVIAFLFKKLSESHKYNIILLNDSSQLSPWKWNNLLGPHMPENIDSISLSQPSIFRIVMRTKLPFFGPVHSSPINDTFFKTWGFSELPKHATVCPITSEGFVMGMVLSFELIDGTPGNLLDQTTRYVEEMTIALQKITDAA